MTSQSRADVIQAELAAAQQNGQPDTEGRLRFALARALEFEGDIKTAVRTYLQCYNSSPNFTPALSALIRLFSRRRSFNNLGRLLNTASRTATDDEARASALITEAVFLEGTQGDLESARGLVFEASSLDPKSAIAAYHLERMSRAHGDVHEVFQALTRRAACTKNAHLRALLLHDVAEASVALGDYEGAKAAIVEAQQLGVMRWRTLATYERLARRQGAQNDLSEALEGLASIAEEQAASLEANEAEEQVTSLEAHPFETPRFFDAKRARAEASALLAEAAQQTPDPTRAAALYRRGSELEPNDAFITYAEALCLLSEAASPEDTKVAIEVATSRGTSGVLLAHLKLRAAMTLWPQHQGETFELIESAEEDAGTSPLLDAARQWLLRDGGFVSEWVDELEAAAVRAVEAGRHKHAGLLRWRAALVLSRHLGDFSRAKACFEGAALVFPEALQVLRDYFDESLFHGQLTKAREIAELMLDKGLTPEERAAVRSDRVNLLIAEEADEPQILAAIREALADSACDLWALDYARLYALETQNWTLLSEAHEALSQGATDDAAAAYLAAGARAHRLAGKDKEAESFLRRALERRPGHRYATAMLEEIYRAQGRANELVALLQERSRAQDGRQAVVAMLLAGAAAEAAGDTAQAADSYEQACDVDPDNPAPLWALKRLGESMRDSAQNANSEENAPRLQSEKAESLVLRALEALCEIELRADAAGPATLELAEHYAFISKKPALSERAIEAGLKSGPFRLESSVLAHTLPGISPLLRIDAQKSFLEAATGETQNALLEALSLEAMLDGVDVPLADSLLKNAGDAFASMVHILCGEASSKDWLNAPGQTTNAALRCMVVGDEDGAVDAFLLAQDLELDGLAEEDRIIAIDETLQLSDDAELRANSLLQRSELTSGATKQAVLAGAARAATQAGRPDAVYHLELALEGAPDDLSLWASMRVAARAAADWERVVEACDRLAHALDDGDLRWELIEEACAIRMDHLGLDGEARRLLRLVNEADPARDKAYFRLHDLLAETGDTRGLLRIVTARIKSLDDAEELARLYYEKARLHRSHDELEEAIMALENLSYLDTEHVGGVALSIEIYVALERWEDAVSALKELACSNVPNKQRRVALLGAADFLERRLDDPARAFTCLVDIHEAGLADVTAYERLSRLCRPASQEALAVDVLLTAADRYQGEDRAKLLRLGGALQENLGDKLGALLSMRQALSIAPTATATASRVAALSPADQRVAFGLEFDRNVRQYDLKSASDLNESTMKKLLLAAEWRDDAEARWWLLEAAEVFAIDVDGEEPRGETPLPKTIDVLSLLPTIAEFKAPLFAFFDVSEEAFLEAEQQTLKTLGVGRKQLVAAGDAFRDALVEVSALFSVDIEHVFRGGRTPPLEMLPLRGKRGNGDWAIGQELSGVPGPSIRAAAGLGAFASALKARWMAGKDASQIEARLRAMAQAAGISLPGAGPLDGSLVKSYEKAIPWLAKRNIASAAETLKSLDLGAVTQALDTAQWHAALLVSGKLDKTLEAMLKKPPTRTLVLSSEAAKALLWTSVSPQHWQLSRKEGV